MNSKGDKLLQTQNFKHWFKSRAKDSAKSEYYCTQAEVMADTIIDEMF